MNANSLLLSYGQLAGLRQLAFDANGCARLEFAEEVTVDLEMDDAGDAIQVYSVLGPLPSGPCEGLYRELLEGNLFVAQTGGATLAIDPVQQEIILCMRLDATQTDAAGFQKHLATFVAATLRWSKLVGSELNDTGPARPLVPTPSEHHHLRG